jgi:hypothetical protein
MVFRDIKRTCPFCGHVVSLDDCAIVATVSAPLLGGDRFDDIEDELDPKPVARTRILVPAKKPEAGGFSRRLRKLPPVTDQADAAEIPRRACTSCQSPLPLEMDEFDAHVLAIVGLNRAGKTYFLGAALNAATRNDGLYEFGVTSFTPLDDTPSRLHNDYYRQLFQNTYALRSTQVAEHAEKSPLSFLVEFDGAEPFVLVTHDVSGEALMDRSLRASTADFVSRADAVIFIADPLDMLHVHEALPTSIAGTFGGRNLDQPALLEAVTREIIRRRGGRGAPLALTVSKSDLLSAALGQKFAFDFPRPGKDWKSEVTEASAAVRSMLLSAGERKLVSLVDRYEPHSYHAISVLGHGVDSQKPQPLRVLDPLGTVLEQMRRLQSRAR